MLLKQGHPQSDARTMLLSVFLDFLFVFEGLHLGVGLEGPIKGGV